MTDDKNNPVQSIEPDKNINSAGIIKEVPDNNSTGQGTGTPPPDNEIIDINKISQGINPEPVKEDIDNGINPEEIKKIIDNINDTKIKQKKRGRPKKDNDKSSGTAPDKHRTGTGTPATTPAPVKIDFTIIIKSIIASIEIIFKIKINDNESKTLIELWNNVLIDYEEELKTSSKDMKLYIAIGMTAIILIPKIKDKNNHPVHPEPVQPEPVHPEPVQ